jgi:hypothetical protein
MADDILGHEHLDHGKHLHKPGFHPKPSYWMGIWVKHPRDEHHDDHGEHGKHDAHAKDAHAKPHAKVEKAKPHAPAPPVKHAIKEPEKLHTDNRFGSLLDRLSWTQFVIALAILIPTGVFIYSSFLGLIVAAAVIGLNIIVEYHKWFTEGSPLDFEILTFGAAYLAATGYFFWALVVAVIGPYVADKSRGPADEDTGFRMFGVVVSAIAGLILGPATLSVFIAVIAGVFAQFIIASLIADNGPVFNMIESGSTVALAAYLVFFVLPILPFV